MIWSESLDRRFSAVTLLRQIKTNIENSTIFSPFHIKWLCITCIQKLFSRRYIYIWTKLSFDMGRRVQVWTPVIMHAREGRLGSMLKSQKYTRAEPIRLVRCTLYFWSTLTRCVFIRSPRIITLCSESQRERSCLNSSQEKKNLAWKQNTKRPIYYVPFLAIFSLSWYFLSCASSFSRAANYWIGK